MKKNLRLLCSCFLFVFCTSLFSQTKTILYQQLPDYNGNPSTSGIFFGATMSVSTITVTFAGPADRWFAFGFGSLMVPADVLTYSNGQANALNPLGWRDFYNTGVGPIIDPVQDWTVLSTGTVAPNQRTVTATRALNTGDPNDAVINYASNFLGLIWAKGATADYTLATHGSTNRCPGISLPWLSVPVPSFNTGSPTVCANSSLSFLNTSTGGQTSYTWSFQGGIPASSTATNISVMYSTPGTYSVSLIASNALGTSSLVLSNYITVTPTTAASATISLAGGSNPMCSGALATFTLATSNCGPSPSFQWVQNGAYSGLNSPTFTTNTLGNLDLVLCAVTSDLACSSPLTFICAPITMTVNSSAPASASVTQIAGTNPMCSGAPVTFTVATFNGGSAPAYQWQINGLNAGTNSPTFTSSSLANNDVVNCILSSSSPCASATLAVSAGVTMSVSSVLVPAVSIIVPPFGNPLCAGSMMTFSASPVNGGAFPVYQWQLNGSNVGTNSPSFSPANATNGNVLSCIMLSALSCASPSAATSSPVTLTVLALPLTPSILTSGPTTFCAGGSVTLNSSAASGNLWSNGAITQSIVVNGSGTYIVTQIVNGCSSLPSQFVTVVVKPLPAVNMGSIAQLCASADPITLSGGFPAGGIYSGTGVSGGQFSPAESGIGSFTVGYAYTGANGCQNTASTTAIVDACLGIYSKGIEQAGVSIFPNPSAGQVTVHSAGQKIMGLRVADASGKIIFERKYKGEQSLPLDLSAEPAGLYTIDIVLENKTVHSRISKKE